MKTFRHIVITIILFMYAVFTSGQSLVPDSSFNANGQVLCPQTGLMTQAHQVIQQPDGKLLVGGEVRFPHPFWSVSSFFLYRLNANGQIDVSFGDTGKFQTKLNPNVLQQTADFIQCMKLRADNKIILGGAFNNNLGLMRLKTNGTPDSTFGVNGLVETDLGTNTEGIRSLILLNNGVIFAAAGNGNDFVLIKYKNDGTIDSTFGTNGMVISDFNLSTDECSTILIQPDGKIVAAGYTWNNATGYDFALIRYTNNGSLDPTFGNSGKVSIDFGTLYDYGSNLQLKANGNFLIIGSTTLGDGKAKYAVAEINTAGVLNPFYGNGGKAVAATNLMDNFPVGSVLLSNNDLLIGGSSFNFAGNLSKPLLMKLSATGSFDYSLNGNGFFYYQNANETNSQFYDLMMQQDGKIVGCGHTNRPGDYRMNVVRFKYSAPVITTSLREEGASAMKVYPNPSVNWVVVESAVPPIKLELMNELGKTLLTQSDSNSLDISGLEAGIYFLLIHFEDGSHKNQKLLLDKK